MRTEYHEVSGVSSAFYPEFQGVRRPKNVVGRPAPLSNLLFLPVSGHAILGVWRPGHLKNFWKIVEDGFNKEGTTKAQSHAAKIAIEKDSEGRLTTDNQQSSSEDCSETMEVGFGSSVRYNLTNPHEIVIILN